MMIEKIQQAIQQQTAFDALLLTSEINRRYATGFPSSAGVCLICAESAHFFTDFRYIQAAKEQITHCQVEEIAGGRTYAQAINACMKAQNIKCVALESCTLTHAEYLRWQGALESETVSLDRWMMQLRQQKTKDEIDKITGAQRIAERALENVLNDIRVGVTEKEIAAKLTYLMLLYGAQDMSFDPIVVSGENSAKPHGTPSAKAIQAGEFVTMDFGCIYEGYCSDMTRTVAVGHCTQEMQQVYQTVLHAQRAGMETVRAGVTGAQVDAVARDMIEAAGYGHAFGHGFGHGVGCEIHEDPTVSPSGSTPLQAGMIITAEPGIYLAGKFGVRIEDMLVVEETQYTNLTKAPKELLILS